MAEDRSQYSDGVDTSLGFRWSILGGDTPAARGGCCIVDRREFLVSEFDGCISERQVAVDSEAYGGISDSETSALGLP